MEFICCYFNYLFKLQSCFRKCYVDLAKAVKIKKFKSIDEALKLASTIKLTDNSRVNAFNQNGCDANLKRTLVEIVKQLSNLRQLVLAMMKKINKNTIGEIIDKSSRTRNFYSRDQSVFKK